MTDNRLLFIDMETTGLDARDEVPLELGLVLTDEWGNIRAQKKWLIDDDTPHWDSRVVHAKEHAIVGPMHTESGLWADLSRTRPQSQRGWNIASVDDNARNWLRSCGVGEETIPLAGNSIGSLDRPFLLVHFPLLNAYTSYRNIDISSFKEVCRRVNPELFEKLKPWTDAKAEAKHRVLEDIFASIKEYRAYLENFLWTSEDD